MPRDWSGTISFAIVRDDAEIELEIEGTVSAFYPGNYSGPPDSSFPDEGGEAEIVKITNNGIEFPEKSLTDAEKTKIEELLQEMAGDSFEEPWD